MRHMGSDRLQLCEKCKNWCGPRRKNEEGLLCCQACRAKKQAKKGEGG